MKTKSQPCPYALSTIAMSVYNVLAKNGNEMSQKSILEGISGQHPEAKISHLKDALKRLIGLQYITLQNEKYRTRDPQRRMVIIRDRSDAAIDAKTGEITGGWNSWMVHDRVRGMIPVAEVTQ